MASSAAPARAPATTAEEIRHVAAGGWRRAVYGTVVGLAVGTAVGLVLPREPRRTSRPGDAPRSTPGVARDVIRRTGG